MKQKKIILIRVQVCRYFLPVDITEKQDFAPNVKVKKGFYKKKQKNMFWFSKANKLHLCGETKRRDNEKYSTDTERQRKIHHGRISWKEWTPFITQMARHVREAERDGTSEGDADGFREIYRQRCARCWGGGTEEQWRGGEIIGWKRMREGWSFYFWAEHSSQAEFILVGSWSLSPRSLCLYFLHPARVTELILLKSQTGFPLKWFFIRGL